MVMCLTAAKVQKLQAAIEQLEDLVEDGSASCHSRQAALAASNPPLFADIQVCTMRVLETCGSRRLHVCLQHPCSLLVVQGVEGLHAMVPGAETRRGLAPGLRARTLVHGRHGVTTPNLDLDGAFLANLLHLAVMPSARQTKGCIVVQTTRGSMPRGQLSRGSVQVPRTLLAGHQRPDTSAERERTL